MQRTANLANYQKKMQCTSFFSLTMEFNALIVMKYGIMTCFFYTSALSTANLVVIATFFAVTFGIFNINSYFCTAKTVAIATKFAVRIIKGKEIWL